MTTENDVPLGEGARRYYEQQFGDRIRKVRKGGGPAGGTGGSGWNGRVGVGVVVGIVIVVLRIVLAVGRTDHKTPQYSYTPPPPVRFDFEQQKAFEGPLVIQNQDIVPPGLFLPPAAPGAEARDPALLVKEDIPLLQGLCYRIHRENLQPGATPGGRVCRLLDGPSRELLARAAGGQALDEEDRDDLIEALNQVLQTANFYNGRSFRDVKLPPDFLLGWKPNGAEDAKADLTFNRSLLEKCYPEQIVPTDLRARLVLDGEARASWLARSRKDFEAARRQFEGINR